MYKQYIDAGASGSDVDYWTENWDKVALPRKRQLTTLYFSPAYREIRKRLAAPARLLEAGCGMGHWVVRLSRRGYRVVGLDYSLPTLVRLSAAFPEYPWAAGDVLGLGLADRSFDGLLSWGVIEHLEPGPDQALSEAWRVLRPGGWLFVTVPFLHDALADELSRAPARVDEMVAPRFHQHWFTRNELRACVERAGFAVAAIRPAYKRASRAWPQLARRMPAKVCTLVDLCLSPFVHERTSKMVLCVASK